MAAPDEYDEAARAERACDEERSRELPEASGMSGVPVSTDAIQSALTDAFERGQSITDIVEPIDARNPLAEFLRRSGNAPLADRYLAAWAGYLEATRRTAQLRSNEPSTETSDAASGLENAVDAFERVTADVSAWFKYLSEPSA